MGVETNLIYGHRSRSLPRFITAGVKNIIGLRVCTLTAVLLVISGCAATVLSPVADADRSTSGIYSGQWILTRLAYKGIQTFGTVRFNCQISETRLQMTVENGIGKISYRGKKYQGNISKEGKFRIEIPTEYSYKSKTGDTGRDAKITFIFQGSLASNKLSGMYTEGMAQLNNQGCSAIVKIQRSY